MKWYIPTEAQISNWREWVESRPPEVRALAERFTPWTLYRIKSTGDRVTVASFSEAGTLTVTVSGDFNSTLFERNVFGIDPDDLEECDLPTPNEPRGVMLTPEEVDDNIDVLRVAIRPDLFEMKDGKARRRRSHAETASDKGDGVALMSMSHPGHTGDASCFCGGDFCGPDDDARGGNQ